MLQHCSWMACDTWRYVARMPSGSSLRVRATWPGERVQLRSVPVPLEYVGLAAWITYGILRPFGSLYCSIVSIQYSVSRIWLLVDWYILTLLRLTEGLLWSMDMGHQCGVLCREPPIGLHPSWCVGISEVLLLCHQHAMKPRLQEPQHVRRPRGRPCFSISLLFSCTCRSSAG